MLRAYLLGFLIGVIGLIVGWVGAAAAVMGIWGMGNDGGIGMAAIFQAGPIGGFVGFLAGVFLFITIGRFRARRSLPAAPTDISRL